jgi:hypothetical protein
LPAVASQTFSHTASFSAPTDQAWQSLQLGRTWGEIGGVDEVSDVTHDHDGNLTGYSFAASVAGRRYPGRAKVVQSDPTRRMVVQIETSELRGTITVSIEDTGHSGEITVDMTVASKSFLGSMMFPVIAASIGTGLRSNVEEFAAQLG